MQDVSIGITLDIDKPNLALGKLGVIVKALGEHEGVTVTGVNMWAKPNFLNITACDATTADTEEPDDAPEGVIPPDNSDDKSEDDEALRQKLLEACKARDIVKRDSKTLTVEVLKAKLQAWKDAQEAAEGEQQSSSSEPSDERNQEEDAITSTSEMESEQSSADGADIDELRGVIRDFSNKKSANAAKAILKKFGATNATSVPADKIAECIAALTEAM